MSNHGVYVAQKFNLTTSVINHIILLQKAGYIQYTILPNANRDDNITAFAETSDELNSAEFKYRVSIVILRY